MDLACLKGRERSSSFFTGSSSSSLGIHRFSTRVNSSMVKKELEFGLWFVWLREQNGFGFLGE